MAHEIDEVALKNAVEKFVKECDKFPNWYSKVRKILEPVIQHYLVWQPTFKIGQHILIDGEEYLLACVKSKDVCAVGLSHGNRWQDPIQVVDPDKVTYEEMMKIAGFKYEVV